MAEKLLGAGVNLRVMALGVQERHLIDVQKFDPVLGGVLEENSVNIAAHGHNPVLSEKILEWARKMEKDAIAVGADSINVVGVCCTGNELAMRHGVKLAAHNAQSELILATGAVDCMVVDIQCIWPSLPQLAQCFDTAFITTDEMSIFLARATSSSSQRTLTQALRRSCAPPSSHLSNGAARRWTSPS